MDIEGPVGRFTFPVKSCRASFRVPRGGTRIAPSVPCYVTLLPRRAVTFAVVSARSREEFAYEEELQDLARNGQISLQQTITRGGNPDGWTGARGRIGFQPEDSR